jgi:hypothetical protein
MSGSRDGERMLKPSSGTSMKSQRLSRTTTGILTHSILNPTVAQLTSDVLLLTLDGGNYLDSIAISLRTRKERC